MHESELEKGLYHADNAGAHASYILCSTSVQPTQRQNDCACSAILRVSSRAIACSVRMDARGREGSVFFSEFQDINGRK